MLIHHLVSLLPPEYQARLAGQDRGEELETAAKMLKKVKRIKLGKADLPAVDEAGAGAGRMAMSEVRLAGEPPGPPQDQEEPAGE